MDSNIINLVNEQKKTNRLLAVLVLRGLENKTAQILLLNGAGFRPGEIAELVGTTSNSVSVAIAKAKGKKGK